MEIERHLYYGGGTTSQKYVTLKLPGANVSVDNLAVIQTLTKRERTIIQMVSSGARNKEVAFRLCISEHTVKAHLSSIFRKTQSRNRVELLRWAQLYQGHFELVS